MTPPTAPPEQRQPTPADLRRAQRIINNLTDQIAGQAQAIANQQAMLDEQQEAITELQGELVKATGGGDEADAPAAAEPSSDAGTKPSGGRASRGR